ncbi:MAG: glycosyltransferase, partial [Actinomycetes bacterium]
DGPERAALEAAHPEANFLGSVNDAQLRWLYHNADFHLTASHEDFGLTPLEAAAFGTPTIAPRQGGFLDTIIEGHTGLFFDELSAQAIAKTIGQLAAAGLSPDALRAQAEAFSEERFAARIAQLVEQLAAGQIPER